MNDEELMRAVRGVTESLGSVRMTRPVTGITGRARSRRVRRSLSAAGAGCLVLGLGIGLTLSPGAARPHAVHVSLDGFSVNTTADGKVAVTVADLSDPALMQQVLGQAGVPAIVWVDNPPSCYHAPAPPPPSGKVIQLTHASGGTMLTIDPTAIPPGSEVDIGFGAPGSPGFPAPLGSRPGGLPKEVLFGVVERSCQPSPSSS